MAPLQDWFRRLHSVSSEIDIRGLNFSEPVSVRGFMTNVNLKKGDKIYSSYEGAVVEHELVAAGPKYLTIRGNHLREYRVVRDTMLSDNDRGHKTQYYATRDELIEAVTKASAWSELRKILRDRYSAPDNLTAAQLLAALSALKGE